jgi:hypothetical protein
MMLHLRNAAAVVGSDGDVVTISTNHGIIYMVHRGTQ